MPPKTLINRTLTHAELISNYNIINKERACIWDRSDWRKIKKVYSRLRKWDRYLLLLRKTLLKDQLGVQTLSTTDKKAVDFHISYYTRVMTAFVDWYENALERSHNDQTIYWFDSNEKFEPQQLTIVKNKLTAQGLARSAMYMTGQAADYPRWIALGIGTHKVEADQKALVDEIFRNPVDYYVANQNIISSGTLYPEGILTNLFSEFGGMTAPTSDVSKMVWRSVIENASKRLNHTINQDRPSTAHSLYVVSK